MSHALTMKGKKAEMAYVGEKPWHGLGQQLKPGASIEVWAKEAGMSWNVERSMVRYAGMILKDGTEMYGPRHPLLEMESNHVLFRSDSKRPLSVVSKDYKIVQPKEVLEFFRDLTEQNKFTLETAGTLFGGRRYWALAKTGHELNIGKDRLGGYLLLATSCDGSLSTTAKFTSVRVVCNNTLTASMNGSKNAIRVRHTANFKETEVKLDLGLIDETWTEFGVNANLMAKKKINRRQAVEILVNAIGDGEQYATDIKTKSVEDALIVQPNVTGMAKILALFDGAGMGAELTSSKDTLWGLVNATTQYYDHLAGRSQDSRLSKAWFGKNENKKIEVFNQAVAAL